MARIPIIDLDLQTVPDEICAACEKLGVFYVQNHGVPQQLVYEVFRQARFFFALPVVERLKLHIGNSPVARGYQPFGQQRNEPTVQQKGDTKEIMIFGVEKVPSGSQNPDVAPNLWPNQALLPHYQPVIMEYYNRMARLGERLVQLVAQSLDAPSAFDNMFTEKWYSMNTIHYSSEKSDLGEGVLACGGHTDWGFMTLLVTDGEPGLQLMGPDGGWQDVTYQEGAVLVNLGDVAERVTRGRFKSIRHRVFNSTGCERYSIPFFMVPDWMYKLKPLPQCCTGAQGGDDDDDDDVITCADFITMKSEESKSVPYAVQ